MEPVTIMLLLALWFFASPKKKKTIPAEKEPVIYGEPGPVDRPDIPAESEYLAKVDALISAKPRAKRFWQITAGGPTASDMAATVLAQHGANTGANRLRLIKCMTRIAWNDARYTAAHPAASWGLLYNVGDQNLSAAWLPRHAPAAQMLASRESPPRTIDETGKGAGGYYGLLWIPSINVAGGALVCTPENEGPPAWLLNAIGGS